MFSFGQPDGAVVQTAYVVSHLHQAIDQWISQLGIGPWFVAEHFRGLNPQYRGTPAAADVSIAMAYTGHMCIELIQPHDDQPSVFRDVVSRRGFGFHHWGIGTHHFDELHSQQQARGNDLIFTDQVPGGGRIAYHDSTGTLPGMIELIEMTSAGEALFKKFQEASVNWDRREPLRKF